MSLFEFVIAVIIIVGAPVVFWFFYSIVAVRLGFERKTPRLVVMRELRIPSRG